MRTFKSPPAIKRPYAPQVPGVPTGISAKSATNCSRSRAWWQRLPNEYASPRCRYRHRGNDPSYPAGKPSGGSGGQRAAKGVPICLGVMGRALSF